tara:strand:- start:3273 stop:6248 length:2976 start_codon:yes stop_codon:yes gene_type:complete
LPKIPLYNQGAGPTQGLAAGQLSPRASTAAFTAPGRAFAGFQQTLSKAGKVAADFELAQQKINADTLDTQLMSRINEKLSSLDAEELDDVTQVETRANEILTDVFKSIEDAPRINSRLKSGIKNKTASRFSSLTIPLKQNTVTRKQQKQAESSIKGLDSIADNISRGTIDYTAGVSDANLIFNSMEESGANRFVGQTREEYISTLDKRLILANTKQTYESVEDSSMPLSSAIMNFDVQREQTKARQLPFKEEQELLDAIDVAEEQSKTIFYNNSLANVGAVFDEIDIISVDQISTGLIKGETDFTYQDGYGNKYEISFAGLDQKNLTALSETIIKLKTNKQVQQRDIIVGSLQDMVADEATEKDFNEASNAIRDGMPFTYTKKDGSTISINSNYLKQSQQGDLSVIAASSFSQEEVSEKKRQDFSDTIISATQFDILEEAMLNLPEGMEQEEGDELAVSAIFNSVNSKIRNLAIADEQEQKVILEELNILQSSLTTSLNGRQSFELSANKTVSQTASRALDNIFKIKAEQQKIRRTQFENETIQDSIENGTGEELVTLGDISKDRLQENAKVVISSILADKSLSEEDKTRQVVNVTFRNNVTHDAWVSTLNNGYKFGIDASFTPDAEEFSLIQKALNLYNFLDNYSTVLENHATDPKQRAFFDELNTRVDFDPLEQAVMDTRKALADPVSVNIKSGLLKAESKKLVAEMDKSFFGKDKPLNIRAMEDLLETRAKDRLEVGTGDVKQALEWAREDIARDFVFVEGHYQRKDDLNTQGQVFLSAIDEVKSSLVEDSRNKTAMKVILDPTMEYKASDIRVVKNEFAGNYIITDPYGTPLDGVFLDEQGNDTGLTRLLTITPQELQEIGMSQVVEANKKKKQEVERKIALNASYELGTDEFAQTKNLFEKNKLYRKLLADIEGTTPIDEVTEKASNAAIDFITDGFNLDNFVIKYIRENYSPTAIVEATKSDLQRIKQFVTQAEINAQKFRESSR